MLPDLSALTIGCGPYGDRDEAFREWSALCGTVRPRWKRWGNTREKTTFRVMANLSENDRFSGGQYTLPYSLDDIDKMIREETSSIEHILPRSLVNGKLPGAAEADIFGWDVCHRTLNSVRSNLPLALWPNDMRVGVVNVGGVKHFNPPAENRDRLARRWLYVRATYQGIDHLAPPSAAQLAHADAIIEVVRASPLSYAEKRFHGLLEEYVRNAYRTTWGNPLCRRDAPEYERALALARTLVFDHARRD